MAKDPSTSLPCSSFSLFLRFLEGTVEGATAEALEEAAEGTVRGAAVSGVVLDFLEDILSDFTRTGQVPKHVVRTIAVLP